MTPWLVDLLIVVAILGSGLVTLGLLWFGSWLADL